MSATSDDVSCEVRKGKPWYINRRYRTAKRIRIGRQKGIYYRKWEEGGKTRNVYVTEECKKRGGPEFWKLINDARAATVTRSKTKSKTKSKTRSTSPAKEVEWQTLEKAQDLLKMHGALENIGLPKNAFMHDICYYLNDLKALARTNGQWDPAQLVELDAIVPILTNKSRLAAPLKPSDFQSASGVFFGWDKIKQGARIKDGAYGSIYAGEYGKLVKSKYHFKDIVLKEPLPTSHGSSEKDIVDFYAEHIMHSEIYCALRQLPYVRHRARLPKPIFFAKYRYTRDRTQFKRIMGLEKMDDTLHTWLHHLHTFGEGAERLFLQMLKSIALLLKTLQEHFQFHHRDLHASNVMYNRSAAAKPTFDWYLIDLGMSIMTIDGYGVNRSGTMDPYGPSDVVNNGHDMRALIMSMDMEQIKKAISGTPTMQWLTELHESLMQGLDDESIGFELARGNFHRAYDHAFKFAQSPATEPDAIIADVDRLSRGAAATRIQTKGRQRAARNRTKRLKASARASARPGSRRGSRSKSGPARRSKSKSKSKSSPRVLPETLSEAGRLANAVLLENMAASESSHV